MAERSEEAQTANRRDPKRGPTRATTGAPAHWWLGVNGYRDRKRVYDTESTLKSEWDGEPVTEIERHMPLAWILEHPPAEWELADKEYGVVEVMVSKSPPSWK